MSEPATADPLGPGQKNYLTTYSILGATLDVSLSLVLQETKPMQKGDKKHAHRVPEQGLTH